MSPRVAVIAGAGPAGLTAAYELLKRTDIRPLVFEETDAIGGIARTHVHNGNRIDIGGHRFFSKSDRVMRWWFNILPLQGAPAADTVEQSHEIAYAAEAIVSALCPACAPEGASGSVTIPAPDPEQTDTVMLQRPRLSRIYWRKHFFPYPLSITLSVARRLGLFNTFLIALSYLKAQMFPLEDETYLDAFFINRFGKRLFRTFFKSYTEKVWGVPCNEIRADWGAQRVKGLSLKRAVVHAVKDLLSSDFQKAQRERETTLITRFYYPKFGPGQMWETVTDHVRACGGDVTLRRRVTGVHVRDGRVTSAEVEDRTTGERSIVPCDVFFSTMPIKDLADRMDPALPQTALEIARGLEYRDFLTVGLLLRNLHVLERGKEPQTRVPDNWIYVQDETVQVGRIQIFNNWSPYMVRDRKRSVWIGLEYFVTEGEGLWQRSDEELIKLGIREMDQIGFLLPDDILDACVLRMPKAYPAYFGTYPRLQELRNVLDPIENLYLIGRNGMHRYNNQDHSMLTAMLAVDNLVSGRKDKEKLWNVNLETEYHESKASDAE